MDKGRFLREDFLALSEVVGLQVLLAVSIQSSFVLRGRNAVGKEPRPDYLSLQQAHPW